MISVAICTRNRAPVLDLTLRSLAALPPGPRWEVLVCGNACSDDTQQVTERYADRLPIRFVAEPNLGLSNARNRALAEVQGEIVAFIDDDVTVAPEWLIAVDEARQRFTKAGVMGGRISPQFPEGTDPSILQALPSIRRGFAGLDYGDVERVLEFPAYPFGANMAFRAEAIRGLAFDPSLGYRGKSLVPGEEREFIRQVVERGWEIQWMPRMALTHHIAADRLTIEYLTRLTRDYTALATQEAPAREGRAIAGIPRHLLRRYAVAQYHVWRARLFGRHSDYLARRLELARVLGHVDGTKRRRDPSLRQRRDES